MIGNPSFPTAATLRAIMLKLSQVEERQMSNRKQYNSTSAILSVDQFLMSFPRAEKTVLAKEKPKKISA
jgi:hypothetical protein